MDATLDPGTRIAREYARGEFAYWDHGTEARWREAAPPEPEKPALPKKPARYGLVEHISPWSIKIRPNSMCPLVCELERNWEWMLDCGRSYMVGRDVPMADYIRRHRSPLNLWQKAAYEWSLANPYYRLQVKTPGHDWEVYAEGNYVLLALPHQDAGGERHYVSKDGRTKVCVNID